MYRGKCVSGDDAKEFREQRNLTQWQMAELLGIAEITLQKWEARGFASCPERATKLFMSVLEREDAGTLEIPKPKPLGRPKRADGKRDKYLADLVKFMADRGITKLPGENCTQAIHRWRIEQGLPVPNPRS